MKQLYEFVRDTKEREETKDLMLLMVRIALAWIFIYHGGYTLFGWFGGGGVDKSSVFFDKVAHLHPAKLFTIIAGATELFGSIMALIGVFGRFGALTIAGDMVIAMITVTFSNGIASSAVGGGYELNLALAALAGVVVFMGTGRISLDYAWKRMASRNNGTSSTAN